MGTLEHGGLDPDGFQGGILFPQGPAQLLCLTVKSVQIVVGLLQDEGSRRIVLFRFFCGSGELIQGIQPSANFSPFRSSFISRYLWAFSD